MSPARTPSHRQFDYRQVVYSSPDNRVVAAVQCWGLVRTFERAPGTVVRFSHATSHEVPQEDASNACLKCLSTRES